MADQKLFSKRRRSSSSNKRIDCSATIPPTIQVWSEEELSNEDDIDEDEVLTPKVFSPGGPMFLLPEIRDNFQEERSTDAPPNNATTAVEENGILLQVPGAVPRRRHSWICG